MILINEDNIEDQPLKNMIEVLNSLTFESAPEFTINNEVPVIVVTDSNRTIRKRTGNNPASFMVVFEMSIVDETRTGTNTKSKELRTLLKTNKDLFSVNNMNFFEIQSSPSSLVRNDKTYNVQNFTVQYIVH